MSIDRREDAGDFYPGGKVISTQPLAPGGDYLAKEDVVAPSDTAETGQAADAKATHDQLAGKVPTSRTINGKALSSDVTLTGADVAVSDSDATKISDALAGKANNNAVVHLAGNETIEGAKTFTGGVVSDTTGTPDTSGGLQIGITGSQYKIRVYQDKTSRDLKLYRLGTWEVVTLRLVNGKTVAFTAANPTAGNLAALDASGNPVDAGWTADDLARYSLTTKTITNNAVALDDRACNYVDARTLGSSDSLDIDFPALVDGKARDFVLAVECGANPPAISYAAFVTIMAEDASTLTPEEGMNIYSFKEFKTNMFIAARKLVGTVVSNTPESADQMLLAMQKRGIDTTGITNFGGIETALGLSDTDTPQDAVDAIMN